MHGYIFEFVKFKAYKHILSICDFIYLISLVEKHWLKLICFITIWFSLLLLLLLLSLFSHVQLCATPWTAAYQAFLSMGFSRQEHWSGLPFPSPMHESGKWKGSRSVVSDSVQSHRRKPTRLSHPWDSPGKNTGVGCHFLLQCVKVKSESEVAQSCPTLSDPVDCSLRGSSVHRIFKAKVLEWGAIAFSDITATS